MIVLIPEHLFKHFTYIVIGFWTMDETQAFNKDEIVQLNAPIYHLYDKHKW